VSWVLQLHRQAAARDRVEGTHGFVQQQQRRSEHECSGDRSTLAHSARELGRPGVREGIETNKAQQRIHSSLVRRLAGQMERQSDIGTGREPGQQTVVLEGDADPVKP
jgi:hypothetical protein